MANINNEIILNMDLHLEVPTDLYNVLNFTNTSGSNGNKALISLRHSLISTKLGEMIAISDDVGLYLLEFMNRNGLKREIEKLKTNLGAVVLPGTTSMIKSIETELKDYFNGSLKKFTTPLHLLGSPFQKLVWHELTIIPYGQTRTYAQQAKAIGKPKSFRAVANANAANQLAIIIPCHRIVTSNGAIGGYSGGKNRKAWLIDNEKKNLQI